MNLKNDLNSDNGQKKRLLCSTGALIGRVNNYNYKLIEQIAPQLDCDGYELMMDRAWYENLEEIVKEIEQLKLFIPVMHCDKRIGELFSSGEKEDLQIALNKFRINCEVANRVGAKKMVIHLWNGELSDRNFQNHLHAFPLLNQIAMEHRIELLVENVVCNVENPMKHWVELREYYSEVHFIFDTKMAAFHQQMELIYQDEYQWLFTEDRIHHYHVNDYSGGYMEWSKLKTLPIGAGKIDFAPFFQLLSGIHYQGFLTVEATAFQSDGSINVNMLNQCFSIIRKQL